MSISARMTIDDGKLGDMPLTITVTMTVSEWRELMRQTPTREWPANDFGRIVSTALGHIARATSATFDMS